jgi:hypothetical protein
MVDAAKPITPAEAAANAAAANAAAAGAAATSPRQVTPGTDNVNNVVPPPTPGVVDPMNAGKPQPDSNRPTNSNYQVSSAAGAAGQAVSPGLAATADVVAANPPNAGQASPGNERRADRKAGAGINGTTSGQVPPTNDAPDAASAASPNGVDGSYAIASITRLFPGWKEGEGILLVLDAAAKMRAVEQASGEMQITAGNATRDKASADSAAAAAAAQQAAKDSGDSFWGDFATVLGAVGALLACLPPIGTVIGVIMLVIAIIVLANTVSELITGHSILGNTVKLFGGNANTADEIDRYVTVAAQIVVGVVAVAEGNPQTLQSGLAKAGAIVSAAGTAGATAAKYHAASQSAESKRDGARASESRATVAQVDEYVAQIIKMLRRSMDAGDKIIGDTVATFRQAGHATSSVKYVA